MGQDGSSTDFEILQNLSAAIDHTFYEYLQIDINCNPDTEVNNYLNEYKKSILDKIYKELKISIDIGYA